MVRVFAIFTVLTLVIAGCDRVDGGAPQENWRYATAEIIGSDTLATLSLNRKLQDLSGEGWDIFSVVRANDRYVVIYRMRMK